MRLRQPASKKKQLEFTVISRYVRYKAGLDHYELYGK